MTLIIILLLFFLYVEFKHPYYFLQDDNRDYFLPYFIYNYKSLLNGELAVYNFHQFLGIPSLAVGQPGALYPIAYLSVFLSNLFFGHYFAAVDIQVIIHLLIGAVGIYKFIRSFDIERKAAFFAGFIYPLSSFIFYISNSWVVVSSVAAYFPWMLLFSFRLYKDASLKTIVFTVIARLLLFYAGYVQYFIYSVIFELITVFLYVILSSEPLERKANIIKFIKEYIKSYIYVLILSLPLLLPMWHHTTISAHRSTQLEFSSFASRFFPLEQLLKGLFYPFSNADKSAYVSLLNMFNLSHIGYIAILLIIIGIADRYITRKNHIKIKSVKLFVFAGPALLAFIWSTNWMFNYIIYLVPILNRFRWPFKLAFFLDFFLIVIAAFILSHFIEKLPKRKAVKNIAIIVIIVIQIFNFGFLYTVTPYKALADHGDSLPLEEKLTDELTGGRIISVGSWTSAPENNYAYLTAPTLGFNYATLWGLDYFAGYEPLIPATNAEACLNLNHTAIIESGDPIPIDYLRKAAVKWYIVPKNKVDEYSSEFILSGIIPKYEDENRVVFYDEHAFPMVFNSNGEKIEDEDLRVTANKIEINIHMQKSDTIFFNYLYNPFLKAYLDGERTALDKYDDIHISVTVPEGKHQILIKYEDPYFTAGICVAIAFLVAFIGFNIIQCMRKHYALKLSNNY